MKTFSASLQNSVQSVYSNNGKTTVFGRAYQKQINSQNVIGPALTGFIDVQTIAGFIPTYSYFNPNTNHLFVLGPVSATPTVALFTFNSSTGAYAYVGKIIVSLGNAAATTYVLRGFAVYENGSSINVLISATGSVVINGGTYVAYNCTAAQFTTGGTTIFAASGSAQNAVYFLQDPAALGSAHIATSSWGVSLPQFSSSSGVNTKVWQWNGTVALPVLYSWDLSLTPTVAGLITNGVSAQTTLYAGTSPSAFFTMGASNNGYAAGDQVVLMSGTGGVPTGFNAWTAGTTQVAATNVYFIRDLQLVSGNYYFNLASTSGGAAITPTSSTASFTMLRAFGINSSLFSLKTGTLPAFTGGTILQNNSVGYCKPISSPANTALQGQDCLYMATAGDFYIGKISDLTSLGTTWASMNFAGVNILGIGTDIVAPTLSQATYSGQGIAGDADKWIYITNTSTFVMKTHQNSTALTAVFGGVTNTYYETLNPVSTQMGATAITGINCIGGWFFSCSSGIGQRGIIFADIGSDATFGYSGVVSPVLSVLPGSTFKAIDDFEQLFDYTDAVNFWIRSASTSTDASFSTVTLPAGSPSGNGTISNGWTSIQTASDLSSIAIGPFFQLCATYQILTLGENSPAQIYDFLYSCFPPGEMSDNWALDEDNTTSGLGSPSYTSFYLTQAYSLGSVPTLFARVYDINGNLIFSANSVSNPTVFSYSTNGGTSWNALGTIPNTVGTRVRALVTPTPSVVGFASVRET